MNVGDLIWCKEKLRYTLLNSDIAKISYKSITDLIDADAIVERVDEMMVETQRKMGFTFIEHQNKIDEDSTMIYLGRLPIMHIRITGKIEEHAHCVFYNGMFCVILIADEWWDRTFHVVSNS